MNGSLMMASKYSHSNYKIHDYNISYLPASSKVHHIYLDPSQFPTCKAWLMCTNQGNGILHHIKSGMSSVRHTPLNEEMQTIFETEHLSVLEGGVVNEKVTPLA